MNEKVWLLNRAEEEYRAKVDGALRLFKERKAEAKANFILVRDEARTELNRTRANAGVKPYHFRD